MNSKKLKFIKYLVGIFSFAFAFILFSGLKVNANSTDLYFPKTTLAQQYNEDGRVTLKESIDIYAYNNGAGYQIDQSTLRISEVIVTEGTKTYKFEVGTDNFNNNVQIVNKVEYGDFDKKYVDKITLKIGNFLENNDSNEVTISFKFQLKEYFLFFSSWNEYTTTVNYYREDITEVSPIKYYKTDTTFTSNKLEVTDISISGTSCTVDDTVCYNKENYDDGKKLTLKVKTNFKVKGNLYAYYNTTISEITTSKAGKITLVGSDDEYTNIFEGVIDSNLLKNDSEIEYLINQIYANGVTDYYNSNINSIANSKSITLVLDTKAPKIESAGVIDDRGDVFYDYSEIFVNFKFSEVASFTLTKIKLKTGLGGLSSSGTKKISGYDYANVSYNVSCNGQVNLQYFSATLEDKYGNTTNYTNETDVIDNEEVYVYSNVIGVSVVDGNNSQNTYSYYYNGELVDINFSLKSYDTSDFNYTKIELVGKDETIVYDSDSWIFDSVDEVFKIQYEVTDKITYFNKINFYVSGRNIPVHMFDTDIYLNQYLDLEINGKIFQNETVVIFNNSDGVSYTAKNIPTTNQFNCISDYFEVVCNYEGGKDQILHITLDASSIILDNGQKNKTEEFTYIANINSPVVTAITVDNAILYEDKYYFSDGNSLIKLVLSDELVEEKICLNYAIIKNNKDVGGVVDCDGDYSISLPNQEGIYKVKYFTSDGLNESSAIISKEFAYVENFLFENIKLKINDNVIVNGQNVNKSKNYNYINLDLTDNEKEILLAFIEEIEISIPSMTKFSPLICDVSDDYCVLEKNLFAQIDEEIEVEINLIDKLGNKLKYIVKINLDTINPGFENILISKNKNLSTYTVTINGYDDNNIYILADGVRIELDEDDSFTTSLEKYTIVLTDPAGNESRKVFTNVHPGVELYQLNSNVETASYEINISPFDTTIHQVEDFKYLVFNHTKSDINDEDLKIARANLCTQGRNTKCYKLGNTNFSYNGNVVTKNMTFNRGFSYILDIKVTGELLKHKSSEGLVRLDLGHADLDAPVGEYLEEDSNPDYISSTSNIEYEFKFKVSDENLSDTYKYLIVDNTQVANSYNFVELYNNCYGAVSSENKCGLRGEEEYLNDNIGSIIITSGYNSKRLLNNNRYALYVLLSDTFGNISVFKIREFTNVTNSSVIEYLDDEGHYRVISNNDEVTTVNSTKVRISRYNNIGLDKLYIDDVEKTCSDVGCQYDLSIGKYTVKVVDMLGNESIVVIYSGYTGKPIVDVYYKYNEDYFKILDDTFTYNSENDDNIFIKVTDQNITSIKIKMNTEITYLSGDEIVNALTSGQYGMSLASLMEKHNDSEYSGNINIVVKNSSNLETALTLTIDNEVPAITLAYPNSKINLLGSLYNLDYFESKYSIEFNYQHDITYSYLMSALSLKVDGIEFEDIINIDRFKFRVDGIIFNDYQTSIVKGERVVTVDYFDAAGNEAKTITIIVKSVDNEPPIISLNNALQTVELNKQVTLAQVIIEDNHDGYNELNLAIKIGSELIEDTNYVFTKVGEFEVTYTVTDTSGNSASLTQVILVRDTTAPVLIEGTTTSYSVSINELLQFSIPQFEDSDPDKTIYSAYDWSMYNENNVELNKNASNYPLYIEENNKINLKFNTGYALGIYKIRFVVKDNYDNVAYQDIEIIVHDGSGPVISVNINGISIDNEEEIKIDWGSLVELDVSAIDDFDGPINNITRKVTFNGNSVAEVNTSISGKYIVEYTARDSANNITTFQFTINVSKDETKPLIQKVTINGVELNKDTVNKVNSVSIVIEAVVIDDSNDVITTINFDGEIIVNNGETIILESGLTNVSYIVIVESKDGSDNTTTVEYVIDVDNKGPSVVGAEHQQIYNDNVLIDISDVNIESILIYRDGTLYSQHNNNVSELEITQNGIYRIVSKDTYGNEKVIVFVISKIKEFAIIGENNIVTNYVYDNAKLVEVEIEDDELIFKLDRTDSIDSNDQIYILVNYPNSTVHKYVAYSMNGETYTSNNRITLDLPIIEGARVDSLLEKIDDKYYAYLMIIDNSNEGINDSGSEETSNFGNTMKTILMVILVVFGIVSVLFLIVKLRKRVRAI